MNILHIAFINYNFAEGVRTVVESLIHAQQILGHNVRLLNITSNNEKLDYESDSNSNLEEEIMRFNPQIAIFHSIYKIEYIKISRILQKANIPYLVQLHGGGNKLAQRRKWWKKKIYNKLCANSFIAQANGIIYLNEKERDTDIAFSDIRKTAYIIPNGINIPQIEFKKTENSKLRYCFLSRLDFFHKGLDVFCEAWNSFYSKHRDYVEFHVYGSINTTKDQSMLDMMIRRYGAGMEYHGPVYGEEKQMALLEADIFVLTSRFEGMPMSILEALSYGIPCLVTPETNVADIVTKNNCGWTTDLTVDDICDSLEFSFNDYKLRKDELKKNCLLTANQYTWDKVAVISINVYKDVIKRKYNEC